MRAKVADRWIVVGGLRVHYLAAGDAGPPVLLLHGGGIDSAALSYRFTIAPLSQHRRVFAPDWPGFGESDPPGREVDTEYFVDFLEQLMDSLRLEKTSLVGLSMGGAMALGLALRDPRRVEKLVLVDSYGLGREIPHRTSSYLMVRLPLLSEVTWAILGRSKSQTRRSLESIVYDPRVITEDLVEEVHRLLKRPGVARSWISFQRNEISWRGLRTNFVDRLHQLAVPTLIVHGAQDRLVPVSWAERADRLIPRSQLRILPECGHWPPWEKPEEFNRVVLEFLGEAI